MKRERSLFRKSDRRVERYQTIFGGGFGNEAFRFGNQHGESTACFTFHRKSKPFHGTNGILIRARENFAEKKGSSAEGSVAEWLLTSGCNVI